MYIGMDGTGVPVIKAETVNRRGKGEQGEAKTRDAKLGCVFTQTSVNEKGFPVRDEHSTSYVGAIEGPDTFGPRLYAEALRRGLEKAQKVCVMGDGAPWIWNLAEEHFYGAIQINRSLSRERTLLECGSIRVWNRSGHFKSMDGSSA